MSFTLFMTWLCISFGLLYGLLDDHLHYFETLHHDTLRHQITKRDVENKPDCRILEYASHKRNFKLILHRNTDVFSSDFRASVVDEENRQQNVDVEREFYQGFEECKFSILFGTACLSQTFQDIAFAVFPQMLLKQMPQFLIFPCICHF